MKHENNGLIPDDVFMSARLQIAAQVLPVIVADVYPDLAAEEALEYADALIATEQKNSSGSESADKCLGELVHWAIANGFSTGHAGTLVDLMDELEWQIKELRKI